MDPLLCLLHQEIIKKSLSISISITVLHLTGVHRQPPCCHRQPDLRTLSRRLVMMSVKRRRDICFEHRPDENKGGPVDGNMMKHGPVACW